MILDYKIIFFCQFFFCLFYEAQFLIQEFTVVDDFPTIGTNKVVVMFIFFSRFEFISALSITKGKFGNNAHSGQQVKCTVDSAQS